MADAARARAVPSVHLAVFPMGEADRRRRNPSCWRSGPRCRAVRNAGERWPSKRSARSKVIKANLSAQVRLEAPATRRGCSSEYREFLPTLFGVSQVELVVDGADAPAGRSPVNGSPASGRRVTVSRAEGVKCERCWRLVPSVSATRDRGAVRARCVDALADPRRTHDRRASASAGLELAIVVGMVVLDQITKVLVRRAWRCTTASTLIPGLLSLTRVHNTGAAFGMFNGVDFAFKTVVMSLVALVALAGVGWYAASVPTSDVLARVGVAGSGRRRRRQPHRSGQPGYVLDFVDAYWSGWHFWAFNVADAAITIGVGCMILDLLGLGRRASNPV